MVRSSGPMLSDRCPSCMSVLSVCSVGVLWLNGWIDQDKTFYGGIYYSLDPDHIVLGPSPQSSTAPPQFSAHVCCGQTARWIKMPLSTEVVLGPGDIVLDGDPATLPSERDTAASLFSAHVYCGQTPAREETTISGNKEGMQDFLYWRIFEFRHAV